MDLSWNGQRVDGVEVVRLPQNVSLEQAANFLTQNTDGRDTLGVHGADGDYLVLGHGLRVPAQGESLAIDGQAVLPAFLENENDTKAEGFVDSRDQDVGKSQLYTGITALAGGIAGGIIGGRYFGKVGGAVGSAIGLPVAGLIHNFVFRPLARKISGKPTREMAAIDTTVITRLIGNSAYATGPQPLRRITPQGLTPLNRSAVRPQAVPVRAVPAPVTQAPTQPAMTGLPQPDVGAGDASWQGD